MLWSDIDVSVESILSMIRGLEKTRSRMFAPLVGSCTSWSKYKKLVRSSNELAWVKEMTVDCQSIKRKLKSPSIIMSQRGVDISPMHERILFTISSKDSLEEMGGLYVLISTN